MGPGGAQVTSASSSSPESMPRAKRYGAHARWLRHPDAEALRRLTGFCAPVLLSQGEVLDSIMINVATAREALVEFWLLVPRAAVMNIRLDCYGLGDPTGRNVGMGKVFWVKKCPEDLFFEQLRHESWLCAGGPAFCRRSVASLLSYLG